MIMSTCTARFLLWNEYRGGAWGDSQIPTVEEKRVY